MAGGEPRAQHRVVRSLRPIARRVTRTHPHTTRALPLSLSAAARSSGAGVPHTTTDRDDRSDRSRPQLLRTLAAWPHLTPLLLPLARQPAGRSLVALLHRLDGP